MYPPAQVVWTASVLHVNQSSNTHEWLPRRNLDNPKPSQQLCFDPLQATTSASSLRHETSLKTEVFTNTLFIFICHVLFLTGQLAPHFCPCLLHSCRSKLLFMGFVFWFFSFSSFFLVWFFLYKKLGMSLYSCDSSAWGFRNHHRNLTNHHVLTAVQIANIHLSSKIVY